jgi:hypothetical protein
MGRSTGGGGAEGAGSAASGDASRGAARASRAAPGSRDAACAAAGAVFARRGGFSGGAGGDREGFTGRLQDRSFFGTAGSRASHRRGVGQRGALAWGAGAGDTRGAWRESGGGARRSVVGREVAWASAQDASRGAGGARLRSDEFQEARPGARRGPWTRARRRRGSTGGAMGRLRGSARRACACGRRGPGSRG